MLQQVVKRIVDRWVADPMQIVENDHEWGRLGRKDIVYQKARHPSEVEGRPARVSELGLYAYTISRIESLERCDERTHEDNRVILLLIQREPHHRQLGVRTGQRGE